jgi:hypothetical protein
MSDLKRKRRRPLANRRGEPDGAPSISRLVEASFEDYARRRLAYYTERAKLLDQLLAKDIMISR